MLVWFAVLWGGAPLAAQQVASSPAPETVSVTVYRAPNRGADEPINLRWLNGYALITETRRVSIPAGEGDIRFEGVAGGIVPESAIVTGLPSGVIEKNQDAYLLSPASLLDRTLGRRVNLRRTSAATGEVREQEAVVRSGKDGAVVLQTGDGFEALRCTGQPETIVYDRVPEGLSAKPTLSVRTRSAGAATATVTLSYLASGFDWEANYVGTLSPAGDRLHLFAWVTLANGDETSFRNASTQTVAGRPNRQDVYQRRPIGEPLQLRCWPAGTTTSDLHLLGQEGGEEIVVTGMRSMDSVMAAPPPPAAPLMEAAAMKAQQEELGDLKLYRIPEPVTVASQSQKQVAMLERRSVKVATVYRQRIYARSPSAAPVSRVLVTRNRTQEGLGLPLPAGKVVLFGAGRERPILLGEGSTEDKSIGEDVEIVVARAMGVTATPRILSGRQESFEAELVVTNDQPRPIAFEAEIESGDEKVVPVGVVLTRRDGRSLWKVTIPANGSAVLRYRLASQ